MANTYICEECKINYGSDISIKYRICQNPDCKGMGKQLKKEDVVEFVQTGKHVKYKTPNFKIQQY